MARFLLSFGLALVAATLFAQEAEPPAFPIQTELVVLDMVVRAADGQPVTNLRPEEVTILEDGVECPIQSFHLVRPRPEGRLRALQPRSPHRERGPTSLPRRPRRASRPPRGRSGPLSGRTL
jgi:hypothetical protein